MAMLSETNAEIRLPWLNLESNDSDRYRPINFKNSNIAQHSPHSSRIRHIRGFGGPLICVVDTDENFSRKIPSVLFPPNQYVDNRLKMGDRNFNLPILRGNTNLVMARPTLDTMLAMKFFTGLRSMSFRDQQCANIDPVSNTSGWEALLHQLTTEAISPVIEKFKSLNEESEFISMQRPCTGKSMKRMYSSSGRLMTPISVSRPCTSSTNRPSTTQRSSRPSEDFQITPELDTQVFYLLGGILQNPDPEIVKTWLLTSTERERNLMVSILRSALVDKDELNMFVAEASKEKQSRIVYTPSKKINSTLSTIRENETKKQSDILIVHDGPANNDTKPETRPPTSSTFRTNKVPVTRPNTRSSEDWIPSESFVIK